MRRFLRWTAARITCWAIGHDAVTVPEGAMTSQPYAPAEVYYGFRNLCGRCGKMLA